METEELQASPATTGIALAIGIGLVATFLAILALGRAMAGGAAPTVPDAGGGVDDGGAPAAVTVELTEFAIGDGSIGVAEGGSITAVNVGSAQHNLAVRGTELTTPDLNGGDEAVLDVSSLSAGTYEVLCTIAGHEAAGMVGTLTVGAGGDGGTDGGTAGGDPGEELTGMARAEWLNANYQASVGAFAGAWLGSEDEPPSGPVTEGWGNQVMTGERQDDGSLLFELTLDETEWEVAPGEWVEAVGYNGMVPGPMLKVDVGETVVLRIHNELDDQTTTIHPHGIFMHPQEVDGVGYISHDPTFPGETDEWVFETKEPSVGMYHGHDNGVHQVINGAFGAWIVGDLVQDWDLEQLVEDMSDQAANILPDEKVMILNDAGEIGLTLNGKSFPATEPYVMEEGQQQILHYYNEGLTPHPMHLHNNAQLVFAKDGFPLEQPYFADTVNVAPGERYSVLIFGEVPGVWVFHCHILTHVEKHDGSVFGMFTALVVTESDDPAINDSTEREVGNRNGDGEEAGGDAAPDDAEGDAQGDAQDGDAGDGGT